MDSMVLSRALFQTATNSAPFFGAAAMSLEKEMTDKVPTAATDGRKLLVNPEWFGKLDDAEREFVVAHEACHFVLLHCDPSRKALMPDPKRANIAEDYVVNLLLKDSGMKVPAGCLLDHKYAGMTAEQVYRQLEQEGAGKGPSGDEEGEGGSGEGSGPGGDKWADFEGNDVQATAEAEVDSARSDAASAVQRGIQAGTCPAEIERELAPVLEPPRSLADHLRDFVQDSAEAASTEYSYRKPSMMAPDGFCLPSLLGEQVPPVIVLMDTSGSIDEESLAQSAQDLVRVCEDIRVSKLKVAYVDTEIHGWQTFEAGEPIVLKPKGGGGTDFCSAFREFDKDDEACCIVAFSDLYANFPSRPPRVPVIWVEVGKWGHGEAPWGKVVKGKR